MRESDTPSPAAAAVVDAAVAMGEGIGAGVSTFGVGIDIGVVVIGGSSCGVVIGFWDAVCLLYPSLLSRSVLREKREKIFFKKWIWI